MSGVDVSAMMQAYARIKKIPLAKVIRNASKDFVQAAFAATPETPYSESLWVRAERKSDGKTWYIPASQFAGKRLRKRKKDAITLTRLKIRRGFSKATWIGVMRQLGMSTKKASTKGVQPYAKTKSSINLVQSGDYAGAEISDRFVIDRFGRVSPRIRHELIAAEGFKLAAKRMMDDYVRELQKAWT